MATITAQQPPIQDESKRAVRSLWGDAWRRLLSSVTGRIGLGISLFLLLVALTIPYIHPYDPGIDGDVANRLHPPSAQHYFGTDEQGRDIFIRVLYGSRLSISVGFFSVGVAIILGSLLGLFAGYYRSWIDIGAGWIMDIMLAFPSLLLAIAIVTIRGPGLRNTMLAVAIVEIPIFARIARSAVLSTSNQEYVVAARATGVPEGRTLFRHVLPNSLSPMLVQGTLSIATSITSAAALGFLGLGAPPPEPEWGKMLSLAREQVILGNWWTALFPGLGIMLMVLGFNLLGDGMRDALDPRLRQ
ncbi:MAG: ABC transporter permease [Herpetosiphon sp.]